jgi:hypothetical protein
LGIVKSHWGSRGCALAPRKRRKTAQAKACRIVVERKGRAFTPRQNAVCRDAVRVKRRRHEDFATALDLDLPLLHHLQHEFATRGATAALIKRRRGFSSLSVWCERPQEAAAR